MMHLSAKRLLFYCSLLSTILFCPAILKAQEIGSPVPDSRKILEEGIKHHDKGEYKVALAEYRKVPEGDTNYAITLNEMILSSLVDSNFVAARDMAKQGLLLPHSPKRRGFLLYLGHSYDYLGRQDSALACYDSLIRANPYDHQPWYERGAAFFQAKQYDSAIAAFQHSLMLNPWHFRSHCLMGTAMALQGRLTEGYLALCTSLLVTSNKEQAGQAISILSKIANYVDDVAHAKGSVPVDPAYEDIDAIIAAKLAITKDYKFNSELQGDAIINDLHAIMEKISYDASDKNFVMQYYVPLYTRIYKQDRFDPFVLQMFSGFGIESVDRLAKKQKRDVKAEQSYLNNYFDQIVSSQKLPFDRGTDGRLKAGYSPADELFMKATIVSKDPLTFGEGPAAFYKSGALYETGSYNAAGHKQGLWKEYYSNGALQSIITFNDDKIIGQSEYYYENGNPNKFYGHDETGKQTDETDYMYNGILNTKTVKTGSSSKLISYYADGRIEYTAPLQEDGKVADGIIKTFYNSGQPARIMNFAGGKRDGAYKEYYPNGKLAEQSNYRNGKLDGEYSKWYKNGQLHYKITYAAGKLNDAYEECNEAGKLIEKGAYHNGKRKGDYELVNPETGKTYGLITYRNDVPVSYRFTDASGKVLSESPDGQRLSQITYWRANGSKQSELAYEDGRASGPAKYLYETGTLSRSTHFKEDKEDGLATEYYRNGRKKAEVNFKEGALDGFARYYHSNGRISSEGYWLKGDHAGYWHTYYKNGKTSEELFYVDGKQNGPAKNYFSNGRIRYTDYYDKGILEAMVQYDSDGREMRREYFPQGNGKYRIMINSTAASFQCHLKHGVYEGEYIKQWPDGSLQDRGYFRNGRQDSTYESNFAAGGISVRGQFTNGERDGMWTDYERNGDIGEESEYVNGERDGRHHILEFAALRYNYHYSNGDLDSIQVILGDDGKVAGLLRYKDGSLNAYASAGADGKPLQWMPVTNGTARVTTTYPNGTKAIDLNILNDAYEGAQRFYFSNGHPMEEITYKDRLINGDHKRWGPNGKLIFEVTYVDDDRVGVEHIYDKDGSLVATMNFNDSGDLHGNAVYANPKTRKKVTVYYYMGFPMGMK